MDNSKNGPGQDQIIIDGLKRDILIRDRRIGELQDKFTKLMPEVITSIEERELFRRPPPKIKESIETVDPKIIEELNQVKIRKIRFFAVSSLAAALILAMRVEKKVASQGALVPRQLVSIKTPLSGTVKKVYYSEGEFVPKNSVIAMLSEQNHENLLLELERRRDVSLERLKRDQIQLQKSKIELSRAKVLVKQSALPATALLERP